ncbi:MAG: fructose 1,6-bisphosphatase [Thermodesulfobacteriota bacterium]
MLTLSMVKADVGGMVGHTSVHPDLFDTARERLGRAKKQGALTDFHLLRCGDDMGILLAHREGEESGEIHELAWNTLVACGRVAKGLKLHDAGEDLIGEEFHGSLTGMGPAVAEIEFTERKSEPVIVYMTDKAASGAWNLPFFKVFADPFNSSGLVDDPVMISGFSFRVTDVRDDSHIMLSCPEELHYLLSLIGFTSRYAITATHRNSDMEQASAASARIPIKRHAGGGGGDDPVALVRCENGFPSVGEVLEPFAFPHLVEGWLGGSHTGPLMPVPFYEANPTRSGGPPRVIAAGFQLSNGRLLGPHDMFDDPGFDGARRLSGRVGDYMRGHGPFQPHRMPEERMEYGTLPSVVERLKGRFEREKKKGKGKVHKFKGLYQ